MLCDALEKSPLTPLYKGGESYLRTSSKTVAVHAEHRNQFQSALFFRIDSKVSINASILILVSTSE